MGRTILIVGYNLVAMTLAGAQAAGAILPARIWRTAGIQVPVAMPGGDSGTHSRRRPRRCQRRDARRCLRR